MENLIVEVRFQEDPERLSPGRLTGTLLTYERRASLIGPSYSLVGLSTGLRLASR